MLVADINDKPAELVRMALTRARFCQLSAQKDATLDEHICFTAGLISLLSAMMDVEMTQVLDSISATQQLRDILLNETGKENHLLQIVGAIEQDTFSPDLELTEAMNDTYFEALVWADKASRMLEAS
jgi:EAL and modified HD-GYP domain-containing signal transduction protein